LSTRVWAGVAYFLLTPVVAICAFITGALLGRWVHRTLVHR
jgi:hypothetical protein